ncbi:MAG: hypothetical protein SH859_03965 [Hyphomicrobium aestuarii]|nr:hypothetical protein [Hyphomicrobium aestuarii]
MQNEIRGTTSGQLKSGHWMWVAVIAVASVALSLKLQCVLPFAALAAIGVMEMRRSEALTLVGLAWAINQVLGYTVLGYPNEAQSYGWGAMIGLGAVAAVFAGEAARNALASRHYAIKACAVLVMAYAAYEAVLFAARIVLPATDLAFSARIVAEYGLVNAVAFVSLLAIHWIGSQAGVLGRRTEA